MKKLVVGGFVFVLTLMLFTNVFARNLEITEYCGENGLIDRGNDPVQTGDVLNVRNDIEKIKDVTNTVLYHNVTINGNNHKLDGNGFGGFKMVQYNTSMDCVSEINDATITNHDDNAITIGERYVYYLNYGLNLNNVTISSSTGFGIKSQTGDVAINNSKFEDLGKGALFMEQASLTMNNVKISSITGSGIHFSSGVGEIKNSTIEKVYGDGGNDNAIYTYGANLDLKNLKISDIGGSGVSIASSTVEMENSTIESTGGFGIIVSEEAGYLEAENVNIKNCYGGVKVEPGAYAQLENVKISSTTHVEGVYADNAEIFAKDCDIKDTCYEAFYIFNGSTATIITTRDMTYNGGYDGFRSIDLRGNSIVNLLPAGGTTVKLSSGIGGDSEADNWLYIGDGERYTGTLVLGGDSSSYSGNVEINRTKVKLLADSYYFSESSHTVWAGELDILNNTPDYISMSYLGGDSLKLDIDVDLEDAEEGCDYIKAEKAGIENLIINKINVATDSVTDITNVEIVNDVLKSSTTLASSQRRVFGPIYGYDVYISTTGVPVNEQTGVSVSSGAVIPSDVIVSTTGNILTFSRAQDSYNPDILQGKVAIAGANISQEEVFDAIFNNAGNYTFFQKQGSSAGDVEDRAAPTLWVKAFGSQEDVDLEKYTKIKTTYYGAIVGLDCDRQYTDNFDATYGIFASYIGGELKDDDYGNKVKQTGGYAGLRGNWYIGKLFINAIADYGIIQNTADTSSDSNDFNSSVIGLAARLGYNFEVARRSFTIQPSVGVTGKYILTDDFETAVSSGDKLKEKIDDIQNITIEPGLKLAKNLGKCWILTAEGKYVIENVSGDVKIESEDLELVLPDMSYKNYANVGLGIEKIWGYTVLHLKGNKTFGGRDGFVVNAGIEFKF
ncbi:MAG: right-handed parallel beta-helix repeat-containing protein [Elusimicrobia bacterium]|nr:right-handed parallel beta-helix repeat-containing protein [Elusimicrobiota bacterium]